MSAQTPPRWGFLGPRGTFADLALERLVAARGSDIEAYPQPSVADVLDSVRDGSVAAGLVPMESSAEGSVSATIDELSGGEPLRIIDEVAVPVVFAIMARPGVDWAAVQRIGAHPFAHAQCRQWLREHAPNAEIVHLGSNAVAVESVAAGDGGLDAAIASRAAAPIYGLNVLVDGIGDADEASTRFVLVARPEGLPPRTGTDKTTLLLFMREDHPGALLEILTQFAVRGVNLTLISSRPTKRALGDYYFLVDCEGHAHDARVGEAIRGLRRVCADVRFLGSYPRHDGREAQVARGVSDDDFAAAAAWWDQTTRAAPE